MPQHQPLGWRVSSLLLRRLLWPSHCGAFCSRVENFRQRKTPHVGLLLVQELGCSVGPQGHTFWGWGGSQTGSCCVLGNFSYSSITDEKEGAGVAVSLCLLQKGSLSKRFTRSFWQVDLKWVAHCRHLLDNWTCCFRSSRSTFLSPAPCGGALSCLSI